MTHRTLTEEQSEKLARLMIMMEVPKEMSLDILTVVETNEELLVLLDKLSAKNYDMTPEEVYQASIETVEETMQKSSSLSANRWSRCAILSPCMA